MSSSVLPLTTSTRRHLSDKQAETVARLTDAAVEELRVRGYDGLSIRSVAGRAGVAPATAYTYFSSREHLVTEVFWRRLTDLSDREIDAALAPEVRVTAALAGVSVLVADEPALASACTAAMLATDPDVGRLRDAIGADIARRLSDAVGDDGSPDVLDALYVCFTGALVQAGMGYLSYVELPEHIERTARVIFRGAP